MFKQKTVYEMRMSDWSSDVCSSDLDMRDWRRYRGYDWNRYEPGYSYYYADRYYRDGRYYQPRRLTRADRVYRGGNGRYYCRRSDGTTGLIIGGLAGGVIGNLVTDGGSQLLGTLIGAGAGALLGNEIDRGQVIRSEEHTSELQSLMRNVYYVFCLK